MLRDAGLGFKCFIIYTKTLEMKIVKIYYLKPPILIAIQQNISTSNKHHYFIVRTIQTRQTTNNPSNILHFSRIERSTAFLITKNMEDKTCSTFDLKSAKI